MPGTPDPVTCRFLSEERMEGIPDGCWVFFIIISIFKLICDKIYIVLNPLLCLFKTRS